jgi:hypothetical protein
MPIYTNQRGAVQTAYVGSKKYTLTENKQLYWPTSYYDSEDLVAAYMEIDQIGGPFIITLPDATQVSVGENFIIRNIDDLSINLNNFSGGLIQTIAINTAWYFILMDNSTEAGEWSFVQFGAGTSEATATTLDGYGLNPLALLPSNVSKLNSEICIKNIGTGTPDPLPYTVTIEDYTSMLVCTGGSGTIFLPTVIAAPTINTEVPPCYYVSISNLSDGVLTLTPRPGDGIEGELFFSLAIGQTVTVICVENQININGTLTRWFTLGFGRQSTTGITVNTQNVGGAGNLALTASQASSLIQQYTGTLTGSRIIEFPTSVGPGNWYVYNETVGVNDLSVKVSGGANSYVVPTGSREIFYSSGTELYDIPNDVNGTVNSVALTTTNLSIAPTGPQTGAVSIAVNLDTAGATDGQVLAINGAAPNVHWVDNGLGTVTSVDATSTTGLIITGGPITNAGSLDINLPALTAPDQVLAINTTTPAALKWTALATIPGGATIIGQTLKVTGLGPQTVGWGEILNYDVTAKTLGVGKDITFPTGAPTTNNVLIGINVGSTGSTGTNNVVASISGFKNNTGGSSNTGFGYNVLELNSTGSGNTALGASSGAAQTNCTNCTFLGRVADATTNITASTAIGANASVALNNALVLGGVGNANGVNVGIGTDSPTYGLHLGIPSPNNTTFTPTIHLSQASVVPTAPNTNNNVMYVSGGQLRTIANAAQNQFSGAVVTARKVDGTAAGSATCGIATLVGGPNAVTVNTTAVTATSIILVTPTGPIRANRDITVPQATIVPGVSFTINSSTNNPDPVMWLIINPT